MLAILIIGQCVAISAGFAVGGGIYYALGGIVGEIPAMVLGAIVGLPLWYWISHLFNKLSKRLTRIGFEEIPHVDIPDLPDIDFPDLP